MVVCGPAACLIIALACLNITETDYTAEDADTAQNAWA